MKKIVKHCTIISKYAFILSIKSEKRREGRRESRGRHFHEDTFNKSRETELGGDSGGETKRKCENKRRN